MGILDKFNEKLEKDKAEAKVTPLSMLERFDEKVGQPANKPYEGEWSSPSQLDTSGKELESIRDYGVGISSDMESNRLHRAENQGVLEQAGRSIVGGVGKGLLTAVDNVGYLTDIEGMFGGLQSLEDAEGNWLNQLATSGKEYIDEEFPIYRTDPGATWDFSDSGWVFQQIQGLIDSGVGFGLTGAGAGTIVGRGAAALAQMTKMGLITEEVIATVGTAVATNYAESKMMSLELYKDVYDTAKEKGLSNQEAEEMAAEEAREFLWQNKTGILTDAIAIGSIFKGSRFTRGKGKQSLLNKTKGWGTQSAAEAYEEISAGFLQKDNLRDAELKLGAELPDAEDSYLERALAYTFSPEGLLEGALGVVGGPVQSGLGKVSKKGLEKVYGKDFSFGEGSFKGSRDTVEQSLYNAEEFISQTQASILKGNDEEVERLSKTNFDKVAGEFFSNQNGEMLEEILKEVTQDETIPEDKRKLAAEKLANLENLEKEYIALYKKHGRNGSKFVNALWNLKVEKQSMIDVSKKLDNDISIKKTFLTNTVKDLDQKDLNIIQLEKLSLDQQIKDLAKTVKKLENSNYETVYPTALKRYNSILRDMENKSEAISKVLEEDENKVSENVLKGHEEYKEIQELAKSRVSAMTAANHYDETYRKLTNPKYQEELQKTIYDQVDKEIDNIETPLEAVEYKKALRNSQLNNQQVEELTDKLELKQEQLLKEIDNEAKSLVKKTQDKVKMDSLRENKQTPDKPKTDKEIKKEVLEDQEASSEDKTLITDVKEEVEEDYPNNKVEISPTEDQEPPVTTPDDAPEDMSKRPGIAWVASIDSGYNVSGKEANNPDSSLEEYLHDFTIDKVGKKLEFVLETPRDQAKQLLEDGSEDAIALADIRIYVVDEQGNKSKIRNKEIYGYVSRRNISFNRKNLLAKLIDGNRVFTTITRVGPGKTRYGDEFNNPMSLYKDITLGIGDHEGIVNAKFNDGQQFEEGFEGYKGKVGRVYAFSNELRKADGDRIPLLLINSPINKEESKVILKIIDLYDKGYTPKDNRVVTENLLADYGIEGLNPLQVLDLLINQSENSYFAFKIHTVKGRPLSVTGKFDGVKKTVTYADMKSNPELLSQLMSYLQTIPKATQLARANKSLNDLDVDNRIVNDFKWFGETVSSETNYNDFKFNTRSLTTNIVTFNDDRGVVTAVNPWVDYDENSDNWEVQGKKKEQTSKKLQKSKKVPPRLSQEDKVTDVLPGQEEVSKEDLISGEVISKEEVNLNDESNETEISEQEAKDYLNDVFSMIGSDDVFIQTDQTQASRDKLKEQFNLPENKRKFEELGINSKKDIDSLSKDEIGELLKKICK